MLTKPILLTPTSWPTSSAPLRRSQLSTSSMKGTLTYVVVLVSMLGSFLTNLTSAVPIGSSKESGGDVLDDARDGPYNITIQAGIAGAILIVLGFILCFFGYRVYYVTLFIIGFYFLGNLTYVGMANGGVTSQTLLLVVSIIVGVIGGLLLICCSRLGVAILGALALYALGLWILGWKSGGLITSSAGRTAFLVCLVIVGFIAGLFSPDEVVIVGSAIVGAYSIVIGIDMYAHTGFTNEADSFINSNNTLESHFENQPWQIYALLGGFLALAILGAIVQFWSWDRRRPFRPDTVVVPANTAVVAPNDTVVPGGAVAPDGAVAPTTDPAYVEKPTSRWGRWNRYFGRRY